MPFPSTYLLPGPSLPSGMMFPGFQPDEFYQIHTPVIAKRYYIGYKPFRRVIR